VNEMVKSRKWTRPSTKTLLKSRSKSNVIKEFVGSEDYEEAYFNSIGW